MAKKAFDIARLRVLSAFYRDEFRDGRSCGNIAAERKHQLETSPPHPPLVSPDTYAIYFLKDFSSHTPLQRSRYREAAAEGLGGGYFVVFGGKGYVVDPGHHYLQQFFGRGFSVTDIHGIIVTHFHDDHCASLPALMSLLHQRHKKTERLGTGKGDRIQLFLDAETASAFGSLIRDGRKTYIDRRHNDVLRATKHRKQQRFRLTPEVMLYPLPAKHPARGAVGVAFRLASRKVCLLITGDTAWDDRLLHGAYERCCQGMNTIVLVPHVSTIYPREAKGQEFYPKHLCINGLCKAIEAVRPDQRRVRVYLSEIGEELETTIGELAHIVRREYRVDCFVGNSGAVKKLGADRCDLLGF